MDTITLCTINASYIHASLGLRYLYANMRDLQAQTHLHEFTSGLRPEDMVETLLSRSPRIIGFGVYIWNVDETTEVIRLLKILRPDITIVIGGPEVSYEIHQQNITQLADHVITGQADLAFAEFCNEVLNGETPASLVSPLPFKLEQLQQPYEHYTDEDLKQRVLYVEASRGCPFKCEFCLSSLDKTATAFDIDRFLVDMQDLVDRGARQFKFVDRTFNLKIDTSRRILMFFLQQLDKDIFLHFELIPDRLPDALRDLLVQFPPNSLQFEIGIQSFNIDVQQRISRKQKHDATCNNLRWLRDNTQAHVHADLIFGLPGEDLASFGEGFDLLYSLGPQEIQVGILKRLRGTPIDRHSKEFDMRYMTTAPYRVVSNRDVGFPTMQRMVRFARYWDLIGNSGRFPNTLPQLLADAPFARFMSLADWLFENTAQTHRIALPKLFELLFRYMSTELALETSQMRDELLKDYAHNRIKGRPAWGSDESNQPALRTDARPAARQLRHSATAG